MKSMSFRTLVASGLWASLATSFVFAEPRLDINPDVGVDGPVFFRNYFEFSNERVSGGASSSLVVVDGKICVLTAKHLLTDAMGNQPSVNPTDFNSELEYWVVTDNPGMYADDNASTVIPVTSIFHPNNDWEEDIIVLSTDAKVDALVKMTLPLSADEVEVGDEVHMIGCPYSDEANCVQVLYAGTVELVLPSQVIIAMKTQPDDLSGFSGAGIINSDGEIVSVVAGGDGTYVGATLLPDWLKEHAR